VDRLGERDDADWQQQVGVDHAIAQCRDLVGQGVEGLHFYVLNKSQATMSVLQALHS
jgi:methylenetetrahydrofolate reductase (NADPH)